MARKLTKTELTPELQKYAEDFYKKWHRHIMRTTFLMWPKGDYEDIYSQAVEMILRRISMSGPLREGSEMWYIKKIIGRIIANRLDANREDSYIFSDDWYDEEGAICPPVNYPDYGMEQQGVLDKILSPCSEKQKQAIMLYYSLGDFTYAEIALKLGISKQAVSELIRDGIAAIRKHFNENAYSKQVKHRKRSRIMCVETGKVYKNLEEASTDTGVSQPSISRVINGFLQSSKGLTFKRLD